MRKIYIYAFGIFLLGLFKDVLKDAAPHWTIVLLIVVVYLLVIRLIAEKFGKP
ncbi:hypothetical protein [Duganella rhizosphaerae]|uniref:hypothetical protein n=1 Tax=Duganella rhizosphaerae TaxID=2885763 RepID=UPI00403F726C